MLLRSMTTVPAVVTFVLAVNSPAWATDSEPSAPVDTRASAHADYQDLVDEGIGLYKAHRYRPALEKFLQAYAIERDPNLLFNIARCYEAQGESAAAIEKYDEYLADPSIDAQGRERAEKARLALRKSPKRKTATESSTTESEVTSPSKARAIPSESGGTKVLFGWIATAVFVAGSAVSGILALDSADQLRNAKNAFPGSEAEIDRLSKRTLTLSVTADALGAAAAVMGGLSLYWTVASSPSQPEVKSDAKSELKAGIGPGGIRLLATF
ncbi:MAG: hypothetical protein ACM3ZE_24885 [Myxococcales bacterium]